MTIPQDAPRVAVVTGGAAGIGLGIARHLLERGTSVVVADSDSHACDALRNDFHDGANEERLHVVTADVGTAEGASAAVTAATSTFGGLDLLCNNAGVHPVTLAKELMFADWRETFRVNVDAAFLCSQHALTAMGEAGRGTIVNIASVSGLVPYVGGAAYASSKAALIMLTKVLALEAGSFGITVNCICPGSIRADEEGQSHPVPVHIPVGRRGTPDDVAHMVSYLASDAATYVNGAVFVLDGGATVGRPRS